EEVPPGHDSAGLDTHDCDGAGAVVVVVGSLEVDGGEDVCIERAHDDDVHCSSSTRVSPVHVVFRLCAHTWTAVGFAEISTSRAKFCGGGLTLLLTPSAAICAGGAAGGDFRRVSSDSRYVVDALFR